MTQSLLRFLPGILLVTASLFSQASPSKHDDILQNRYLNAPISFEVNRGQADSQTQFLSHGAGYSLLFSERAVTLELLRKNKTNPTTRLQIRTTFVGANPNARPTGEEKLPGVTNYLTGSDPSRWLTNLPTYARLRFPAIYPGVDLLYYGNHSHLEYDFQVAAQSDPGRIRLEVGGAKLGVTRDGELVMATPAGGVAWRKPVAYQTIAGEKQEVACSYVVSGDQVRFALGPYDHRQALTIDPPLVWGSFLGGSRYELVDGIGVDAAGELVVAGTTISSDFPTTPGAYDRTFKSTSSGYALDPFVTKFSADGTHLVYSTYVTGSGGGFVNGMSVDAAGNAYVSGNPGSSDFPFTPGSYHAPQNGISNFLFKLNPAGNNLIYSLVALASGPVAVDASGNAFVAGPWGVTSSVPYPFTPSNAYHNQLVNGKNYISVAKYNSAGTALDYAALIGSAGTNYAAAIAVDSLGEATIAGHNYSLNYPPPKYPVTAGEPAGMGDDALVTKFNASATALVYSALLNGSQGFGISAAANGSVAVTGTASPALPTTANAYELKFQSSGTGVHEPFLTVLDPTGHLTYSTFFAGSAPSDTFEYGFDTALESGGIVNLVGSKHSSNFPITDATYLTNDCEWIARFNSAGSGKSSLLYSGCFSTNINPNQPIFNGYLALNGDGKVYIAGQDTGPTRLTSAQTWNHFGDPGQNVGYELWVGEMNFAHPPAPPAVIVSLPPNGQVSTLPQHYVASATSPGCSLGVAAVGVYTAPGKLQAYQNGSHLDVTFSLPAGQYKTVVQEWDKCGGAQKTPVSISIPPGGIAVSSPANNSTVSSPVHFAATATSPTCANGFSSGIRIYTAPGVDAYDGGTTIDTNLALSPGTYHVVLQAEDNCNNIFEAPLTITVK